MSENAPTDASEKPAKSKRAIEIREKSRAAAKANGQNWSDLSKEDRAAVKKTVRAGIKSENAERKAKREKKKADAAG